MRNNVTAHREIFDIVADFLDQLVKKSKKGYDSEENKKQRNG